MVVFLLYWIFWLRFFNYLVQIEFFDGCKLFLFEICLVFDNDIILFIMIVWFLVYYEFKLRDNEFGLFCNNEGDFDVFFFVGVKVFVKYFGFEFEKQDLCQYFKVFWCFVNCMLLMKMVDYFGRVVNVDGEEKEFFVN